MFESYLEQTRGVFNAGFVQPIICFGIARGAAVTGARLGAPFEAPRQLQAAHHRLRLCQVDKGRRAEGLLARQAGEPTGEMIGVKRAVATVVVGRK